MSKLIVICGPTGVGKSDVAYRLAKEFGLAILNADVSQMHYWMDIGTANIKDDYDVDTQLYKFFDPDYEFSIKDYQTLARERVNDLGTCIVCGGSGLYIDALCLDLDLTSTKRHMDFSAYSDKELYDMLCSLSTEYAQKTHQNNRRRVERYIETILEGKENKRFPKEMYDILYIYLESPRNVLYDRINQRTIKMINEGWIDEALRLQKKGYDLSKLKEIGYSEIGHFLDNLLTLDELVCEIQKETRHYAKRQMTWFRGAKSKYKNYYCLDPEEDFELIKEKVAEFIK